MSYNILAGCLDWTEEILRRLEHCWKIDWYHVRTPDTLYGTILDRGLPEFVFFPHWRWKVPSWLLERVTCVGFHASDLPKGRGGSPIQWRILEGKEVVQITAYQMTEVVDWGPIYCKRPLSLEGPLHEIFKRAVAPITSMIGHVMSGGEPVPLEKDIEHFPVTPRRKPEASNLALALEKRYIGPIHLYDRIRMVDHPDYPRAFLSVGRYTLVFYDAHLHNGHLLTARVDFR